MRETKRRATMPKLTYTKAETAGKLPAAAVGGEAHELGDRAGRDLTDEERGRFAGILAQEGCRGRIARKPGEIRRIIAAYDAGITLKVCTCSIRGGINATMDVAVELFKVRDSGLHLLRHKTFEAYVGDQFNFAMRQAYQLAMALEAAAAVNRGFGGEPAIVDEAQARGLMKLRCVSPRGVEDKKASLEERLKLVEELRRKDGSVPAKLLAKRAGERSAWLKADNARRRMVARLSRPLDASVKGLKRSLGRICAKEGMAEEDGAELCARVAELEALVKELSAGAKR